MPSLPDFKIDDGHLNQNSFTIDSLSKKAENCVVTFN